jgi:hypothetical protein
MWLYSCALFRLLWPNLGVVGERIWGRNVNKQLSDLLLCQKYAVSNLFFIFICSYDGAFIMSQGGVHIAFPYCKLGPDGKAMMIMRWCNVLIGILYVAFMEEMLEFHERIIVAGIQNEAS